MKDDLYYSESCKAVKLLRDEFMLTVNKSPSLDSPQVRIVDFWEDFMRHCSEIRPVDGRARKKARDHTRVQASVEATPSGTLWQSPVESVRAANGQRLAPKSYRHTPQSHVEAHQGRGKFAV
jgi:hypothetical protein